MAGGEPDWAEIRQAYDGFAFSMAQICDRFGVTRAQIARRRLAEGWTPRSWQWRRRELPVGPKSAQSCRPDGEPVDVAEPGEGPAILKPPAGNRWREQVHRLYRVIDKKLKIIEERMENGDAMSPADMEREARSLGGFIKSLEKLTEFDEQDKGGGGRTGAQAGISADEADRIRRELKSRIERMCGGKST